MQSWQYCIPISRIGIGQHHSIMNSHCLTLKITFQKLLSIHAELCSQYVSSFWRFSYSSIGKQDQNLRSYWLMRDNRLNNLVSQTCSQQVALNNVLKLDIAIWFFNEIGENFDVWYGWAYGYQVRIAFLTKNDFFKIQNFQQNTTDF